mmetsp:Transcript_2048/g.3222  ORF Transcript_2048/g.3222 Transcript_2048/m.3222 type:complete len:296 (+) Transcript_2048:336-1223(+)
MGVDHLAGTTDLIDGDMGHAAQGYNGSAGRGRGGFPAGGRGPGGRGEGANGNGWGDEGGGGAEPGAAPPEPTGPWRTAPGGQANRWIWVREGLTLPDPTVCQLPGPQWQQQGGPGQGQTRTYPERPIQQQWVPRPRPPSLLHKLLAKDVRRDRSWLLQAIRFFVRNDFLQPSSESVGSVAGLDPVLTEVDPAAPMVLEVTAEGYALPASVQSPVGNGAGVEGTVPDVLTDLAAMLGRQIDWPPQCEPLSLADQLPIVPDELDEDELMEAQAVAVPDVPSVVVVEAQGVIAQAAQG